MQSCTCQMRLCTCQMQLCICQMRLCTCQIRLCTCQMRICICQIRWGSADQQVLYCRDSFTGVPTGSGSISMRYCRYFRLNGVTVGGPPHTNSSDQLLEIPISKSWSVLAIVICSWLTWKGHSGGAHLKQRLVSCKIFLVINLTTNIDQKIAGTRLYTRKDHISQAREHLCIVTPVHQV